MNSFESASRSEMVTCWTQTTFFAPGMAILPLPMSGIPAVVTWFVTLGMLCILSRRITVVLPLKSSACTALWPSICAISTSTSPLWLAHIWLGDLINHDTWWLFSHVWLNQLLLSGHVPCWLNIKFMFHVQLSLHITVSSSQNEVIPHYVVLNNVSIAAFQHQIILITVILFHGLMFCLFSTVQYGSFICNVPVWHEIFTVFLW